MSDDRREHDWNVAERMRYKVVRVPGEVDEERDSIADMRTHNGDTVQEYYDGVLIREHKLTIQMLEGYVLNSKTTQRSDAIFIIQINLEKKN
jgi:hypothetical protein